MYLRVRRSRNAPALANETSTFTFGGSAIGTSSSYFSDPAHGTTQNASALKMPAYVTLNAFVQYRFTPELTVGLNVNNLTDSDAWTEGEDGALPATNALQVMRARSQTGRTTSLSLSYRF